MERATSNTPLVSPTTHWPWERIMHCIPISLLTSWKENAIRAPSFRLFVSAVIFHPFVIVDLPSFINDILIFCPSHSLLLSMTFSSRCPNNGSMNASVNLRGKIWKRYVYYGSIQLKSVINIKQRSKVTIFLPACFDPENF